MIKVNRLFTKKGFTLIELLVVIAIIGILATFIVASFGSAQAKGRDSRRKGDLDALKSALILMKNDSTGAAWYPTTAQGTASITTAYIRVIPTDPSTTTLAYPYTGTGTCVGTWPTGGCPSFQLSALLENANDPDDAASATRCAVGGPAANTYYVCSQ